MNSDLQKAYALAYKFSQIGETNEERARHRAVAHLIWKSCGNKKPIDDIPCVSDCACGKHTKTCAYALAKAEAAQ